MSGAIGARRIALGLEYCGSTFSGWQAQRSPRLPTVQETLESALGQVADARISTVCAGRTDAGVHASCQVVHFDTTADRPLRAWVQGVNSLLPKSIAVQWAREVDAAFNARFSATHRCYRYLILNRPVRSALLAGSVCEQRRPLDEQRMRQAARQLPGERDFSAFRGAGCQSRTAMRRVDTVNVNRSGELLVIDIQANAFLLHMVRNIAGALMAVGTGERAVEWLGEVLESRDRRQSAATAPAAGLYLCAVGYAPRWQLPEPPSAPWFSG
ncbi:MAG: tRNA pseudouridine(38-40) synthase TruA [Gammaproteobacteria bacterium]|nr:tRNA pseudouridine(38-40) synthase TruA [Gammaproteobacteria bacterium]